MAQAEETPEAPRAAELTEVRAAVRVAESVQDVPIRTLNVAVASFLLLITWPLWVVIAIAVKLTSRGPVFYRQERVGQDFRYRQDRRNGARRGEHRRKGDAGGRPIVIVKFRTMHVNAETPGRAVWARTNDHRLTPIGGFLRSCRLDELPQLLNVLSGDMNLVGPRPERPQLFSELRHQVPNYSRRQRVPPGITGHAQVHLQYDTSVDDVKRKVAHDLEYIDRRTLWEDLRIMLKTIPVMLFRKGGW